MEIRSTYHKVQLKPCPDPQNLLSSSSSSSSSAFAMYKESKFTQEQRRRIKLEMLEKNFGPANVL
jgi:hypothetical protein